MRSYGAIKNVDVDIRATPARSGLGEAFIFSVWRIAAIEITRVVFFKLLETRPNLPCATMYNIGFILSGVVNAVLLMRYTAEGVANCANYMLLLSLLWFYLADSALLILVSSFLCGAGSCRYSRP